LVARFTLIPNNCFSKETVLVDTDSTASAEVEPNAAVQTSQDATAQTGVVIETRNLSKIYRDFWGRKKVNALKSLDIEVRQGEIFGLLGPNGSGKSTTIKLILGLLFPSSGRVLVFDKDASETSKNEKIGYLPEESYLYKFLTAEETLDFYGRLFDMSGAERKKRVQELIDLVGLSGAKHRQLREYSKGMTRRVGLAQALINDPDLILLDEPTTGLDPIGTREMKDLILALKERGKTVLLCSHQLADVQDVCDRVAILHQGELKELGRVSDLLKVQDVTEVHAEGLSEEAKAEIAEVIKRHGGVVRSIDNPTTTMEDLFLNIVRESEARPGARRVSAAAASEEMNQPESQEEAE
jgi:ABC-2 type transport system ATP-binding protein